MEKFTPIHTKKYAFIFGHEVNGVSDDVLQHCDLFIEIPQQGTKHSLNVAVAVGIVSWHYVVRLGENQEPRAKNQD